MTKKKGLSYEEKLINALKSLPNPIKDTKHGILIKFEDDRARSNESRFDHISLMRHDLHLSDIRKVIQHINESIIKKDLERNNTYNLYIKRNNFGVEYIKISLELDFKVSNKATVKTMFITKNIK